MMYDEPGTANLRAGEQKMGPGQATGSGGKGEDLGGTEALSEKPVIYGPVGAPTSGKGTNNIPAQQFNDKAV
jgi:hypothetical protein